MKSPVIKSEAVVVAEFDVGGGPYRNMLRIVRTLLRQGFAVEVLPSGTVYPELLALADENSNLRLHPGLVQPFPRVRLARLVHYLVESIKLTRWIRNNTSFPDTTDLLVIFSITSPGRFIWRYPSPIRPVYFFRSNPQGKFHRLAGTWFRALSSPRARFLGVSDHTKNELIKMWGFKTDDERLGYLRNPGTTNWQMPALFENQQKQVLMVGRLHPNKNPFYWLDVARKVLEESDEKVSFLWLGDGELREKVKSYAKKIGIDSCVHFPGFDRNPYPHYENSYLYLHLARVEPLGNAVVDAIASGLPAVVSAVGGLPEIVSDGFNGRVVTLDNPSVAATAVLEILHNYNTHRSMSRNGRKMFQARFTPRAWEDEFIQSIRGVTSET